MARDGRTQKWTKDTALASERIDTWGIAAIAGVNHQTVKVWRKDYLAAKRSAVARGVPLVLDQGCLLAPDEELSSGGAWEPGRVVAWLKQTGRMDEAGNPLRRPSPGRPRKHLSVVPDLPAQRGVPSSDLAA